VNDVLCARSGSNHICRFDRATEKFTLFRPNSNFLKGLKGFFNKQFLEDQKKVLWIRDSTGLRSYDPGTTQLRHFLPDTPILTFARDTLVSFGWALKMAA
jgi:hypothetical protein